MKKIHNLTLINVMYAAAFFGTILQCQVLFLKLESSQVKFYTFYKSNKKKKILYILNYLL